MHDKGELLLPFTMKGRNLWDLTERGLMIL